MDGYPKPNIAWKFNGFLYQLNVNETSTTSLQLNNFNEEAEGFYACTANNGVGDPISKEFSVHGVAGGN